MTRTILTYNLKVERHQHIKLPVDAGVLSVEIQEGVIKLSALVIAEEQNFDIVEINMFNNNTAIPMDYQGQHLATLVRGEVMTHVFKRL